MLVGYAGYRRLEQRACIRGRLLALSGPLGDLGDCRAAAACRRLNGCSDMPERSIPAMPALRELKSPHARMRSARGKPARSTGRHNAPL
jgi:hypothetical protein